MNRRSLVVAPNIAPKIDIAKSYRRLKRLRRMVKLAESLNGGIKSNGPQSFAFDRRRR
jgi:hypothetical protein